MPNVMRLRRGFERATKAPINQGQAIQVGDLVYQHTDGSARPAGSYTWTTDLATTSAAFKGAFWGVSRDQRLGTEPQAGNILVDGRGEFEFPCDALAAELEPGALIGPAKQAGNFLEPQKVVPVGAIGQAIGRLVERAPIGSTTLLVEMRGTVLHGPTT